jgi:hypothetical protein
MGIRDAFRKKGRRAPVDPVRRHVPAPPREPWPPIDGVDVWTVAMLRKREPWAWEAGESGTHTAKGLHFLDRLDRLDSTTGHRPPDGVVCIDVTGTTFRDGVLDDGCQPCRQALLIPEPSNPHDPNAIAVHTVTGVHVGYIPRDETAALHEWLSRGPVGAAFMWERFDRTGRRYGVKVVAVPGHLELDITDE